MSAVPTRTPDDVVFSWPDFVALVRTTVALERRVDRALVQAMEMDSLVSALREHLRMADVRVANVRDRLEAAKRCLGIGATRQALRELDGAIVRLSAEPAE